MPFLAGTPEALQLNASLLVVIILFAIYHLAMKSLFYKPFFRVLREREDRTTGKLALAEKARDDYREQLAAYEKAIKTARQEGYALAESSRQEALAAYAARLEAAQRRVRESADSTRQELAAAGADLKASLQDRTAEFARLMADRILSREAGR